MRRIYACGILTLKFQRFRLFQKNQLILTCHHRWVKSHHFQSQHYREWQDNFVHSPLNLSFEFQMSQMQTDFLKIPCVRLVVNERDNYLMRNDPTNTICPVKTRYFFNA